MPLNTTAKDLNDRHAVARHDIRSTGKDHLSIVSPLLINRRTRTERDIHLQTKAADHQKSIATNHGVAPNEVHHVLQQVRGQIEDHLQNVTRAVVPLETSFDPESRREKEVPVLLRVLTALKFEDHQVLLRVRIISKDGDCRIRLQEPIVSK